MTYELIQDLCESRVFRTRQAMGRYTAQEATNFFYAYILAAFALSMDSRTSGWALGYLSRTAAFANFDHFRASGTDLYVLAHMVGQNNPSPLVKNRLVVTLRSMAQGRTQAIEMQAFLLRLERALGVSNGRLRMVRRMLGAWRTLPQTTRSNNLQILRREIFGHSPMSEIIGPLDSASKSGGSWSWGKTAGIIAAAGLGGLMLGLRYDPQKKVGPLRVKIGEGMKSDDTFISQLEKNPLVDRVENVQERAEGVTAIVHGTDGRIYGMAFTVLSEPDENPEFSAEKDK